MSLSGTFGMSLSEIFEIWLYTLSNPKEKDCAVSFIASGMFQLCIIWRLIDAPLPHLYVNWLDHESSC